MESRNILLWDLGFNLLTIIFSFAKYFLLIYKLSLLRAEIFLAKNLVYKTSKISCFKILTAPFVFISFFINATCELCSSVTGPGTNTDMLGISCIWQWPKSGHEIHYITLCVYRDRELQILTFGKRIVLQVN